MSLAPLKYPPGIYRNGTRHQAQGRWYDANLVRYFDGAWRPVGGWEILRQTFSGGALDPLSPGSGNLSAHAPTVGSAWTYAGAASDWVLDSNSGAIANIVAPAPARMTNDVADDNLRIFVDMFRAAVQGDTIQGGVWALGKGTLGEGIFVIVEGSTGTLNVRFQIRNAAGALTTDTIIGTMSWPVSTSRRIGLILSGTTVTPYRADFGGGNEVQFAPIVIADLRDGTHKKVGMYAYRAQSSMRLFLSNFTVQVSGQSDVNVTPGVIRKLFAWRRTATTPTLAIGTNLGIYAFVQGSLTNITPVGFTTGAIEPTIALGAYGQGPYGRGAYGVGDSAQQSIVDPASWQLDAFGNQLVGVSTSDGRLWYWDGVTATMTLAPGAPINNVGVVVTPERFVVLLGAGGDPRLLQWANQETLSEWTIAVAATATLTGDGVNVTNGDTVTVGGRTYTFQTTLTNVDGNVKIAASAALSLTNLFRAINASGGVPGTDYAAATTSNTQVTATNPTATTVVVTAIAVGTGGNLIATTEVSTHLAWGSTTMSGGTNDRGAGDFPLPGSGRLMCGRRGRNETLIWTDEDVFAMQYVGGTLVYAVNQVGSKCGIVSPHACAVMDNKAIWMGQKSFYMYDGFTRTLESSVADYVFSDFNRDMRAKCYAVTFANFGEVWFFYPSRSQGGITGGTECDRYVIYNYQANHWTIGQMSRTAGIDRGVFDFPMLAARNVIYQHERGSLMPGASLPVFLEGGPIQIAQGDQVMDILGFIPDEATQAGQSLGSTRAFLYASFRPDDSELPPLGPYTLTSKTDLRAAARHVRLRIEEITRQDWKYGEASLDLQPSGKR